MISLLAIFLLCYEIAFNKIVIDYASVDLVSASRIRVVFLFNSTVLHLHIKIFTAIGKQKQRYKG